MSPWTKLSGVGAVPFCQTEFAEILGLDCAGSTKMLGIDLAHDPDQALFDGAYLIETGASALAILASPRPYTAAL